MPVLQQISCYENEWLPSVLKILSPAVIMASYKQGLLLVLSAVFSTKALQFELLGM
jgi:hypothetical protein